MTPTVVFLLAAAVLLAVVLILILPPLLRGARETAPEAGGRSAANLAIYRDQLAELERDRTAGTLADAEYEQAREELRRRLLEERVAGEAAAPGVRRSPRSALILLFALPLFAATGYAWLGQPQALDPIHTQARLDPQEIEAMLGKLKARLDAQPDDLKGWVMLARSYKTLGRYVEAAEAYGRGGALVDNDATLLLDYADVLVQLNDGRFAGRPEQLIAQALKLDPDEPQALFLAGAAAGEREDYAAVVRYWERLLPQLVVESDEAKAIEGALTRARELAAAKRDTKAPPPSKAALSGEVSLSGALAAQARANDLVFIFARPAEGSRMPLAVLRVRVADLPYRFVLDEQSALPGSARLADQSTVVVEARVARSGQAQTTSGDFYGTLEKVKPGSRNLRLRIDRIEP